MGHPLDKFKYCPVCGSANWEEHNFKSKQCSDCGFVYYANPSSATAAFIMNGRHELLVVRRAKDPSKGTLDLPGGFVDIGEDIEQGMRREVLEETGLEVDEITYLFSTPNEYVYSDMLIYTIDSDYLIRVPNDVNPVGNDDATDAHWIPIEEVNPEDFGLLSIRRGIRRFLAERLWEKY
ncbi:MAG: NUDIX domain-containing protein [Bacteroidaceae bacterium]|nr:NUDIX domain-containing protein [Bacteroidaceae bacterium]